MSNFSFRMNAIGIFFTVIGSLIIWQMGRIQSSEVATSLGELNNQQYSFVNERVFPERGNIYDRWGRLMAGNKTVYELGVNLAAVENPQTIAETLVSIPALDLEYADVLLSANLDYERGVSEYVLLADSVEPDVINRLEEIKVNYQRESLKVRDDEGLPSLDGLEWQAHLQRSYPEKTMASNVLGFYKFHDRRQGVGFYGVEEQYNDLLTGTPVDVVIPLDPNEVYDIPLVPPGDSLILTIDREIQATVERIVDAAVEQHGATSGTVIVMDPRNGEILAMVSTPRFDLNEYWRVKEVFPGNTPFNRTVGETYEPGSVFKVLTMAAALDSGLVTPDTPFLDEGYIVVGGVPIYNWDRNAWGPQTMTGCMQHSLNVCLAWVSTEMGAETFYSYLQAFGINRRTNIDLADEVNLPLSVPGDGNWYPINLGTNAYGQGLAVTPIQMTMAVSAVANEGKMMAPHILRAVISNGRQYNTTPQVISRPITPETAATLNEMLAVSLEEEASIALVPGYRVAGKTGTAQIPDPVAGYHDELTNASFVGWGPVDDPRFVVYVWIEKPASSPWGSVVAAPIFSEIVQHLVVLLNLPPDEMRQQIE
jgi:cell division protein FtsI/penicillin-binding protein 2